MPCYHPLIGVRGEVNANGNRPLLFGSDVVSRASVTEKVPCGNCVGCKLEYARQWSIRCTDEASLHERNCFITLTYDDNHLPSGGNLNVKDWQDFAKRLRKREGKFRYFCAGEYGSEKARPHFHALLFGYRPSDLVPLPRSAAGSKLWRSGTLSEVWPFGFNSVGDVTVESASYVSRYCMKKLDVRFERYVDPNGVKRKEIVGPGGVLLKPEFTVMSRRPGIGRGWFDKFKFDMYPSDFRIIGSMKMKPPRFYDVHFERENPEMFADVRRKRVYAATKQLRDNTDDRLLVKEGCKVAQIAHLKRGEL